MTCQQCIGIEREFNDKVAARELRRFKKRGPKATTRTLVRFIRARNGETPSLLDVGGGVGAIQHELADEISGTITSIDASTAYLNAARAEAERRNYAHRVSYVRGDFVEEADSVEPATVVTLDRVICCYPDVDALLGKAASRADSAVGLVFPRDNAVVRLGARFANFALRVFGREFRAFVHPHPKVEQILTDNGFRPTANANSWLWRIALFERSGSPEHTGREPTID